MAQVEWLGERIQFFIVDSHKTATGTNINNPVNAHQEEIKAFGILDAVYARLFHIAELRALVLPVDCAARIFRIGSQIRNNESPG